MSEPRDDGERAIVARLKISQWRRVRELALELDVTAQRLIVGALSRIFIERGCLPLDDDDAIAFVSPEKLPPA
jgi:hypothetical protein